jgi:hypothetical protein
VQGELEDEEVEAGELVLMKNFGSCRCGALCFMRTIISVKQVPAVVAKADQSTASLRAGC